MNDFIKNVNNYMDNNHIKKSFLVVATELGKDKIYRIMRGDTDPTYSDMEQIADALNQKMDFFMSDYTEVRPKKNYLDMGISFFAGDLPVSKEEAVYTQDLIEFIEHYDALTRTRV